MGYRLLLHLILKLQTTSRHAYFPRFHKLALIFNPFFRFVTILYYLNDVDEGGETAFIVADNGTLNESVR